MRRKTKLYNLKMIIAIGFRTKSSTATAFRVWANNVLQQYMVKGFAIDSGAPYIALAAGFAREEAHPFYEHNGYQKTSYWFRKRLNK